MVLVALEFMVMVLAVVVGGSNGLGSCGGGTAAWMRGQWLLIL